MHEALRRLAAAELMRSVTEAGGVDMRNLDGLLAKVIRDIGVIVVTQPQTWPNGCLVPIRSIILGELDRLMRRGRLQLKFNRFQSLYLEPHDEVLSVVSARP